mmetsp:Transcript_14310/g.28567  ORF Transcript_14310/g.28567 Transcript_14310/m.28567 type:complete len:106 (+) Transcript_14310:46-363(+)
MFCYHPVREPHPNALDIQILGKCYQFLQNTTPCRTENKNSGSSSRRLLDVSPQSHRHLGTMAGTRKHVQEEPPPRLQPRWTMPRSQPLRGTHLSTPGVVWASQKM